MTLVKWNPTHSLMTDFDQMVNTIFDEGWNNKISTKKKSIAVDITENEKAFILVADFPGFEKKEINLNLEEDCLTLSAKNKTNDNSNNGPYRIKERQTGNLSRSFILPENVITDNIKGKFKDGSLIVNIPKMEKIEPNIREIKIS